MTFIRKKRSCSFVWYRNCNRDFIFYALLSNSWIWPLLNNKNRPLILLAWQRRETTSTGDRNPTTGWHCLVFYAGRDLILSSGMWSLVFKDLLSDLCICRVGWWLGFIWSEKYVLILCTYIIAFINHNREQIFSHSFVFVINIFPPSAMEEKPSTLGVLWGTWTNGELSPFQSRSRISYLCWHRFI